jgi:hypothetical protein
VVQSQCLLFIKVRAAAWYQGWGKGHVNMEGEKTCPAHVLEKTKKKKKMIK